MCGLHEYGQDHWGSCVESNHGFRCAHDDSRRCRRGFGVSDTNWLRRLLPYCAENRRAVALVVVGAIGATGAETVAPLIVRTIVDDVAIAGRRSLTPFLVMLSILGVLGFCFGFARRWYAGMVSYGIEARLRIEIVRAMQRLTGGQQDRLCRGQVASRMFSDVVTELWVSSGHSHPGLEHGGGPGRVWEGAAGLVRFREAGPCGTESRD